ncbi:MAG: hypothetical protein ACLQFW_16625 [Xanthobacteraceae bacterium]
MKSAGAKCHATAAKVKTATAAHRVKSAAAAMKATTTAAAMKATTAAAMATATAATVAGRRRIRHRCGDHGNAGQKCEGNFTLHGMISPASAPSAGECDQWRARPKLEQREGRSGLHFRQLNLRKVASQHSRPIVAGYGKLLAPSFSSVRLTDRVEQAQRFIDHVLLMSDGQMAAASKPMNRASAMLLAVYWARAVAVVAPAYRQRRRAERADVLSARSVSQRHCAREQC